MKFNQNSHEKIDQFKVALERPISLEKLKDLINHYKDDGASDRDKLFMENVSK